MIDWCVVGMGTAPLSLLAMQTVLRSSLIRTSTRSLVVAGKLAEKKERWRRPAGSRFATFLKMSVCVSLSLSISLQQGRRRRRPQSIGSIQRQQAAACEKHMHVY